MYRLLELSEAVLPDDEFWGVLDGWKPVPSYAILANEIIDKENGPVRRKISELSETVIESAGEYSGRRHQQTANSHRVAMRTLRYWYCGRETLPCLPSVLR
jgi:hypothetical protein